MSQAADALMSVFGYKRVKPKKCKSCRQEFIPARMGQKACSPTCAQRIAELHRAKVTRKDTKAKLDAIKTLPQLKKETQIAFNSYIRARDRDRPCICCGLPLRNASSDGVGGGFDGGHYRSVGSAPHLRFNEDNAHGQRKQCNRYGAGRAVDYRLGLIARIGLEAVEALERDNTPRHYTKDDLRALTAHYRLMARELMKGQGR